MTILRSSISYSDGSGSESSILIVKRGKDVYAEMIPDPSLWNNVTDEQQKHNNIIRQIVNSSATYKDIIKKRNRLKSENSERIWIRKLSRNQYKKLKNILEIGVVSVGKHWNTSGYTYVVDIQVLDFPKIEKGRYYVRGESFVKKRKGKRSSNYFSEFKNEVFKKDIKRVKAWQKKQKKLKKKKEKISNPKPTEPKKQQLKKIDSVSWTYILYESSNQDWLCDFPYSPRSYVDISMLIRLTDEEKQKAQESKQFLFDFSKKFKDDHTLYYHREVKRSEYIFE